MSNSELVSRAADLLDKIIHAATEEARLETALHGCKLASAHIRKQDNKIATLTARVEELERELAEARSLAEKRYGEATDAIAQRNAYRERLLEIGVGMRKAADGEEWQVTINRLCEWLQRFGPTLTEGIGGEDG
jgi:hypothetical protein